jgi:hypothetical protein
VSLVTPPRRADAFGLLRLLDPTPDLTLARLAAATGDGAGEAVA